MKKVLIIDDNQNQHYYFQFFLGKYFACKVIDAYNGEEGLSFIEKENPDLIILDLMMPGIDGIEVLEKLRIQQHNSSVPVIVVTGYNDRGTLIKLLSLGISDFLVKPFNVFSIYQKLEKHLPVNNPILN